MRGVTAAVPGRMDRSTLAIWGVALAADVRRPHLPTASQNRRGSASCSYRDTLPSVTVQMWTNRASTGAARTVAAVSSSGHHASVIQPEDFVGIRRELL